ncbi:virulence-associated E family protein [Glaciecola sp. KUL10]|uniref:virulence-associated E family protein n=1 Tax=Glaciecola sp. (strain KUL10) TaxID=2161813 RepID=UPI000D78B285|nr:virulence-associated E family protein [Glaciecola sp. KUL10]GBL02946.1 DNA primase domain protein [Glaciecola sp. KUL10]
MASKGLSDFNDLHVTYGIKEVRRQLKAAYDNYPAANDCDSNNQSETGTARQREMGASKQWTSLFQTAGNGNILANISNVKLVLDNAPEFSGVLQYCDFSYRIIKRKLPPFKCAKIGEWTDSDNERMRIYLAETYGFTPKVNDVMGAVLVHAEENAFHPVKEYLHSLEWDKTPRIRDWLTTYLGVESSDYTKLVGGLFLISAIARIMQPPVKVDSVLILEGLQGLGKSTMLQVLFDKFFTDTPMALGDKDSFQQMQGMWCIELAELDSFNKAENTRAKQFFGSRTDRYRPSYGRLVQEFPRQCVFVGTTNQNQYLKDSTGNRRYWPVTCTKIDLQALKDDKDQIWAEALDWYKQGMQWWPNAEHEHLFNSQQEERFDSDVWEGVIYDWLKRHKANEYSMAEIMRDALEMDTHSMRPPEQKRVGLIMTRFGFTKKKNEYKEKDHLFITRLKAFLTLIKHFSVTMTTQCDRYRSRIF